MLLLLVSQYVRTELFESDRIITMYMPYLFQGDSLQYFMGQLDRIAEPVITFLSIYIISCDHYCDHCILGTFLSPYMAFLTYSVYLQFFGKLLSVNLNILYMVVLSMGQRKGLK